MIRYWAEVNCDECGTQEVFAGTFGFECARNAGWMMLMGRHLCPFCQVKSPDAGHYQCQGGSRYGLGVPVEVADIRSMRKVAKESKRCGGFTRMKRRCALAVPTGRSAFASWIGRCASGLRASMSSARGWKG